MFDSVPVAVQLRGWSHLRRAGLLLALVALGSPVVVVASAVPAAAATGPITNFTGPGVDAPTGIVAGPDGAMWFTNQGNNSIGRITTAGVITNFTGTGIDQPDHVVAGPDGSMWFTNEGNNSIGKITTGGVVSTYTGLGIDSPEGITVGSDGNIWFANSGNSSIGRITTSGFVTNYTSPDIDAPVGIVAGSDGNLWFANSEGLIGSLSTAGNVLASYQLAGPATGEIAAGPDGDIWVLIETYGQIAKVTTSGVATYYNLPFDDQIQIAAGPDGSMYYTQDISGGPGNGAIYQMTTGGGLTGYGVPSVNLPAGIATGPDGGVWFANRGNNSIGRLQVFDAAPSGATTVTTSSNVDFNASAGPLVTVAGVHLDPGSYLLSANGDIANFAASDIARCYVYVGSTMVAQTATIAGSPTASGAVGPSGYVGGVALTAETTIPAYGGYTTLRCSHANSNGAAPYIDAGATLSVLKTSAITTSNSAYVDLSSTGGTLTTVLSSKLKQGTYLLNATGNMLNFGSSDFARCYVYVGSQMVDQTATIVGSPTVAGNNGASGWIDGMSLTTKTIVGSSGATVKLECAHDHTNGSVPAVDIGATLSAFKATSTNATNGTGVNLSANAGTLTTLLRTKLAKGDFQVTANGDIASFGASDYTRCYIYAGSTKEAQTSTIVGSPTDSGNNGPAGYLGGIALTADVIVPSAGAVVTLQCSHDHSNGSVPYLDTGGTLTTNKVAVVETLSESLGS
jgi:streptogramin lyase